MGMATRLYGFGLAGEYAVGCTWVPYTACMSAGHAGGLEQ